MHLSHSAAQALQSQLRDPAASSAFLAASSRNQKMLASQIRQEDIFAGASNYVYKAKYRPLSAYGLYNERFRLRFSEETDFKLLKAAQPIPKLNYAELVNMKALYSAHCLSRWQIELDFNAAGLSTRLSQPMLIDLYHDVLSERQADSIPPARELCFAAYVDSFFDDSDQETEHLKMTYDRRYLRKAHQTKNCCAAEEVSTLLSSILADVKAVYCGVLRLEDDMYVAHSLVFQRNDRLFYELYPECVEPTTDQMGSKEQHIFADVQRAITQSDVEKAQAPRSAAETTSRRRLSQRTGGEDWRNFAGQIESFSQRHSKK